MSTTESSRTGRPQAEDIIPDDKLDSEVGSDRESFNADQYVSEIVFEPTPGTSRDNTPNRIGRECLTAARTAGAYRSEAVKQIIQTFPDVPGLITPTKATETELQLEDLNIKSADVEAEIPVTDAKETCSQPNEKTQNATCSQNITKMVDPTIPSPFKRVLFWPEPKPVSSKKIKREKIPSTLSSPQVIKYYNKKAEEKQRKAQEVAKRKEEREQKKKKKKQAAEEQKELKKGSREIVKRKKQAKQIDIESTSESSAESEDNSSSYDEDFEDLRRGTDELPYESISFELLKEGDFVLCEFLGGKRNKTKFIYLCIIQEKLTDLQVMGLKSVDKEKKEFFPNEDDVSSITFDQVIGKTCQPQILTRGERISYVFETSLPVREI